MFFIISFISLNRDYSKRLFLDMCDVWWIGAGIFHLAFPVQGGRTFNCSVNLSGLLNM